MAEQLKFCSLTVTRTLARLTLVVEQRPQRPRHGWRQLLQVVQAHGQALQLLVQGQREVNVQKDRVVDGQADQRAYQLQR